jgi:hypothetical protein
MNELPKPDWFDKPHEEWPEGVKEFYRLLWIGQKRANEAKRRGNQAAAEKTKTIGHKPDK